jgi:hypothetical protein
MDFSIDSDNNVPFEQLNCFAYDLQEDPGRLHKIQPILIGGDGLSKKISIPFLRPVVAQAPLNLLLRCTLPDCMSRGIQYYTSTLSFEQRRVSQLTVQLVLVRRSPDWVRVYESDKRVAQV